MQVSEIITWSPLQIYQTNGAYCHFCENKKLSVSDGGFTIAYAILYNFTVLYYVRDNIQRAGHYCEINPDGAFKTP